MLRYIIVLILFTYTSLGVSQSVDGLVTYLSMENDTVFDQSVVANEVVYTNGAGFGCGTVGDAAYFDGSTFLEFLNDYNFYFQGNFTLSFDFKPTGTAGKQILFAKSESCLDARNFEISYVPSTNSLGFVMSETFDKRIDYDIKLDRNQCWYHIDIVRAGPRTEIYVDSKLVRESELDVRIDFSNGGFLSMSQSPCIPTRASRFEGYLDEVRIYNRPLVGEDLFELYNDMNSILTPDTLVYVDGEIPVRVTDDCSDMYSWSPTQNVRDPNDGNTTIDAPDVGTFNYALTFSEQSCESTDTLKVTVVDPKDVSCEDLVMPSAFTPNEDGLNDIYRISNPFIVEELKRFQIFDRNGGLIFETSNPAIGWDGKYKGEYVSSGNYLYRIVHSCNGEEKVLQGNVIVLR